MRGFEDPLVRGFGRAMAFDRFGADPFFGEELHRGAEEVMEESPLGFIEIVEQRDGPRII
jgi:hypothetical protein